MPQAKSDRVPEQLTRLVIRGFQSFREQEIILRPLNVMIGANGAGKSNLVRFLEMLSFAMNEELRDWIRKHGSASSLLHFGPRRTQQIGGELEFTGDARTSTYKFTLAHAPAGDELFFKDESVEFKRAGEAAPFKRSIASSSFESHLPSLADTSQNATEKTVARVFRKRLRAVSVFHFHDTSSQAMIRLSQDTTQADYLKNHGQNLAAFLWRLHEDFGQHYRRILEEIRATLPELRDFELIPDGATPPKVRLNWRGLDPDYIFGPHQLSDGTLRAVALITLLLQPVELMPDALVIDEPELGLHPHAIGQIARLLNEVSQRRQLIVSTQSPRLLTELEPEDVLVVEKEEGASVLHRLARTDLQGWLDEYDQDLGRLFEMNVTGGAPR